MGDRCLAWTGRGQRLLERRRPGCFTPERTSRNDPLSTSVVAAKDLPQCSSKQLRHGSSGSLHSGGDGVQER